MSIYIGDNPDGIVSDRELTVHEVSEMSRVYIPVHHTGIFGQTGVGKTTLLKQMIEQAKEQGFRILIFDSKVTNAEFEGVGSTIPFYLQESTDPDVYRSLIEGVRTGGKGNMEYYRGGFIDVCEPEDKPAAKTFADIGRNLQAKLDDKKHIHGRTRSMYREIQRDHDKLVKMLDSFDFADNPAWLWDLDVDRARSPVLRMPIRDLPNLSLQGLVVKSVVEALLRLGRKIIIVVDEAPNFVNQKQYNPAKSALQQLDSQGRSKEIFGWYTGQTITGFDKSNMKNLWYWILGREMEKNEVADVFDTQTEKVLTKDQIKKMKVGQFIVSTPDWAKVVQVPKADTVATYHNPSIDLMKPAQRRFGLVPQRVDLKEGDTRELAQGVNVTKLDKDRLQIEIEPDIDERSGSTAFPGVVQGSNTTSPHDDILRFERSGRLPIAKLKELGVKYPDDWRYMSEDDPRYPIAYATAEIMMAQRSGASPEHMRKLIEGYWPDTESRRVLIDRINKELGITEEFLKGVSGPGSLVDEKNPDKLDQIVGDQLAVQDDYKRFHEKNGPYSVYVPSPAIMGLSEQRRLEHNAEPDVERARRQEAEAEVLKRDMARGIISSITAEAGKPLKVEYDPVAIEAERIRKNFVSPPEPKSETKPIGTISVSVTRLVSDSLEMKILYLMKRHNLHRQKDMISKALEHGWVLDPGNVSKAMKRLVEDGTVMVLPNGNGYRFPSEEPFKVEVETK